MVAKSGSPPSGAAFPVNGQIRAARSGPYKPVDGRGPPHHLRGPPIAEYGRPGSEFAQSRPAGSGHYRRAGALAGRFGPTLATQSPERAYRDIASRNPTSEGGRPSLQSLPAPPVAIPAGAISRNRYRAILSASHSPTVIYALALLAWPNSSERKLRAWAGAHPDYREAALMLLDGLPDSEPWNGWVMIDRAALTATDRGGRRLSANSRRVILHLHLIADSRSGHWLPGHRHPAGLRRRAAGLAMCPRAWRRAISTLREHGLVTSHRLAGGLRGWASRGPEPSPPPALFPTAPGASAPNTQPRRERPVIVRPDTQPRRERPQSAPGASGNSNPPSNTSPVKERCGVKDSARERDRSARPPKGRRRSKTPPKRIRSHTDCGEAQPIAAYWASDGRWWAAPECAAAHQCQHPPSTGGPRPTQPLPHSPDTPTPPSTSLTPSERAEILALFHGHPPDTHSPPTDSTHSPPTPHPGPLPPDIGPPWATPTDPDAPW